MNEIIEEELVADLCHKDCAYRGKFGATPYCGYIEVEGHSRNCSIRNCDKYQKGRRRVRSWTNSEFEYDLRYDLELEE